MGPNIHRHPSQTPFTHHPYTDTCPYPISPIAPNTYTHTHTLNPFTHGPKHSQTPIPTCPSPMAHTQTPISIPIHPWYPILTHTHPLNPFTHGPKYCQTPIPHPLYTWPRDRHLSLGHFYPTHMFTLFVVV